MCAGGEMCPACHAHPAGLTEHMGVLQVSLLYQCVFVSFCRKLSETSTGKISILWQNGPKVNSSLSLLVLVNGLHRLQNLQF